MIAFVRGRVAQVGLGSAVIDVGGVGLELHCTPATLSTLRTGATTELPTSMIVREDSLTVYGFTDEDEKSVFEMLLTASGVGPKLAQAMLAVHSPDALRRAVTGEDVKALTLVPGIGQKGAQRIILELKDRIGPPSGPVTGSAQQSGEPGWRVQVREGLLGLGWSVKEADKAIDVVAPDSADHGKDVDVAGLLRAALRTLSRA